MKNYIITISSCFLFLIIASCGNEKTASTGGVDCGSQVISDYNSAKFSADLAIQFDNKYPAINCVAMNLSTGQNTTVKAFSNQYLHGEPCSIIVITDYNKVPHEMSEASFDSKYPNINCSAKIKKSGQVFNIYPFHR